MFDALMQEIDQEILTNMFRSATSLQAFEKMFESLPQTLTHPSLDQFASDDSSGAQQEQPAGGGDHNLFQARSSESRAQ